MRTFVALAAWIAISFGWPVHAYREDILVGPDSCIPRYLGASPELRLECHLLRFNLGCEGEPEAGAALERAMQDTGSFRFQRALTRTGSDNVAFCELPPASRRLVLREALAPPRVRSESGKQWIMQRLGGASGEIDDGALASALETRQRLIVDSAAKRAGLPALPSAWTNLTGYVRTSGRVNHLLIHPTSTNTMWLGSDGGGIWKTTDGGTTWAPLNDFLGSLSIANLVMDPGNPNVMYAGTNPFGSHTYFPYGVLKTTNGGVTWTQLAQTNPATKPDWKYVTRLAIHPADGNILLAATDGGAYQSDDAGATWTKIGGIATFSTFVAFHPADGNRRAVAYMDGTLRYTTNGDLQGAGALTSTVISRGFYMKFAYAPSDTSRMYALLTDSASSYNTKVMKSVNGGATWTDLTSAISNLPHPSYPFTGYAFFFNQGYPFYTGGLWVDPLNADRLGIFEGWAMFTPNASANPIQRYDLCTGWVDFHGIVAHPNYNGTTNKTVFFMDDGGLYKVTDIDQVSNSNKQCVAGVFSRLEAGATITQVYSASGRGGNLILGAQDVSARAYRSDVPGGDPLQKWRFMTFPAADPQCGGCNINGDGATTAASRTNPSILYGSRQYLDILRSSDGGITASSIVRGSALNEGQGATTPNQKAAFIAPFVLDPSNQSRMYAGGHSLWRTDNAETGSPPTWISIRAPLADTSCGGTNSPMQTIAVAPSDPNVVWLAHACHGRVFKTSNALAATPTWTEVTLATAMLQRSKTAILIESGDPNKVWIGLGGNYATVLFRTTDGGANWLSVGGLPSAAVNAFVQHPLQQTWFYAGTGVGLFATADGGVSWSTTNEGPANVVIHDLSWAAESATGADLLVATFGRGVFRATIAPTAPDPPVITGGAGGNTTATISFTPPAFDGGSAITGYSATCNPGNVSATGAASPIVVGGLTNGIAYACTARAANVIGQSANSNAITVTPSASIPPAFTSAALTTFTVNAAGTFTISATGSPAPTLSRTGTLPASVTFNTVTGVLSGTASPGSVGSYPITFAATNSSGTANQAFTLVVAKASQAITFGALANRGFSATPFTVSATASSGLTVAFTSLTTAICTVSGSSVTMVAVGACTVAANQAGDASFDAAPQVQQSFTITAVVPEAPTVTGVTPGNGQATFAFSAPASNGGSPITSFTVTCNPGTLTASNNASPITVSSLSNGVSYSCTVRATNAIGTGAASSAVNVTPGSAPPPAITSANTVTFTVGVPGTFTVTTSGTPTPIISRSGTLPPNISFNAATGLLSGTPASGTSNVYPQTFAATNTGGSTFQFFSLIVAKAAHAITFGALADRVFSATPFTLAATASSGLPVAFSSATSSTCQVSGNSLTMLAPGTCTVLANQGGDADYSAAAQVQQSFSIASGSLTLDPAALAFGGQSMQTTSPARAVTIRNSTGTATSISSITTAAPFSVSHNCAALAEGASCIANVTFTPTGQGSVTANLTVMHSAGPQSIALTGNGERSLATHYYRSILRRAPDAAGKAFWEGEAARVQALGVNPVETWYAMALSFYGSAEYAAFARDNTGFVADLYNTFFNRTPDSGGLTYWTGLMSSGMPREVVLASFMFSSEFAAFTQAIFGNTATRAEINVVVDFYRGLLSRLPDTAGFNYWLAQFRTAQCTGGAAVNAQVEAISSAYATSGEYAGRARTNAQYVGDLYNSVLRRGGDLAGVQFWISQIATGARSRERVRQDFIAQSEFQARVAAVIAQGCLR